MKDKDLCKWLRDNSSGTYRPSAEAATRIEILNERLSEALCKVDETDKESLLFHWDKQDS